MYSRRTIALVFQDYHDIDALEQNISTIPDYVDHVYLLGSFELEQNQAIVERLKGLAPEARISYNPGGADSRVAISAVYRQVIADGTDIAVIVIGDRSFDPLLFPYLLDPIVWGEADFVKGIKHVIPTSRTGLTVEAGQTNSVFIEQTKILPKTPEPVRLPQLIPSQRGIFAISRDGLEETRQDLLKERFWKGLIAIPCYNEALMIASVVLRSRAYVDDVLVVDDGSSDGTAIIAKRAGATVVTHIANRGYGSALRTCFEFAHKQEYDVMVILDGDGQHDPGDVPQLLQKMKETNADIVIGSRFLNKGFSGPFYRRLGLMIIDTISRSTGGAKTSDTQSGFRAYGRKAIDALVIREDSMGAGSEILQDARKQGLKIADVPILVRYDIPDTSSQNPIIHGFDVLFSMIWNLLVRRPLLFFTVPGFVMTLGGLYLSLMMIAGFLVAQDTTSVESTMAALVILIIGVISLFLGLTFAIMQKMRRP